MRMSFSRILRRVLPPALAVATSSCAAVGVRAGDTYNERPHFFGGTISCGMVIFGMVDDAPVFPWPAAVDLPFSLALDCVLLPVDAAYWLLPEAPLEEGDGHDPEDKMTAAH
jgi:uncharacterized protein YceK